MSKQNRVNNATLRGMSVFQLPMCARFPFKKPPGLNLGFQEKKSKLVQDLNENNEIMPLSLKNYYRDLKNRHTSLSYLINSVDEQIIFNDITKLINTQFEVSLTPKDIFNSRKDIRGFETLLDISHSETSNHDKKLLIIDILNPVFNLNYLYLICSFYENAYLIVPNKQINDGYFIACFLENRVFEERFMFEYQYKNEDEKPINNCPEYFRSSVHEILIMSGQKILEDMIDL